MTSQPTKKIIIDTDCGVDDALAILLAASHPHVEIVAITCCFGNTSLTNVWQNVFRVLTVVEKTNIPVYVGCERGLMGTKGHAAEYHGSDGFGGASNRYPIPGLNPQEEHACTALIRIINSYPGEITLVALGPLTNLAIALRLNPSFSKKLKQLIFMGGNIEGKGNTTPAAEFNFYTDPEAASVVLNEFDCPITCVPWEVCLRHCLNFDEYEKLIAANTKKSIFMHDISMNAIEQLHIRKRKGYHSCDLFCMAVVIDENVVLEKIVKPVDVELAGSLTRGQMIVDHRPWSEGKFNVTLVMRLNTELLLNTIREMLK